ncbi:MAG TPA: hypothetical protein ENK43_13465 [Planctomycetes bacterium]|nr:hypothetical protein [Planctomycetota bacterium]
MRRISTLLLTSLLFLASCGGSADPAEQTKAGERALGTQDFSAALSEFQGALSAIGDNPQDPLYLRAKLGEIEARATTDAAKAKDDLIALAAALPGKVSDRDFNRIASRMGDAGLFSEAIALLAKAEELFPDSEHLKKLGAKLAENAQKAGDSSAMDALAGLGYVGDN